MTSHALRQAAALGSVDGPLGGYHREWYVVRPGSALPGLGRVKLGEPRGGVLWLDRRFFTSEDELLVELATLGVPRIPPVLRLDTPHGMVLHGFVEGTTLAEHAPAGHRVAPEHLRQIMARFASLCRLRPHHVRARRSPLPPTAGPPRHDRDSAGFLHSMLAFTRAQAHHAQLPRYGALFARLGVPHDALGPHSRPARAAGHLAERPFCLLHGDLHRANLVVDPAGDLWTIDWELAALGDPLYDLATHLYLMDYPAAQHAEVVADWRRTVGTLLPGADAQLDEDLPRYLDYKRAQSVFTDAVRQAIAVRDAAGTPRLADRLGHAAKLLHDVLTRAADALDLDDVPDAGAIETAYADVCAS
ncbi:phosphotransferase [Streptomyces reniochalinae]|uniref:Aminoglycoside phosphotransferase family protein n=1 Tax=Streptomyces reniochalinae TaxID=2250578 RepID=A0A367EJ94_9ACTN|nr:phosphotransferase [Streptomyces reniochalinae]RCG18144.1 aminoglycoside phosphotransferase family protein [Streptomyces reniochalinae]